MLYGTFTRLTNAKINFVVTVCLSAHQSVRMEEVDFK
jgi:hypothetical protein